eukprot:6179877-Pleurochrysis_carterae.AAC.3
MPASEQKWLWRLQRLSARELIHRVPRRTLIDCFIKHVRTASSNSHLYEIVWSPEWLQAGVAATRSRAYHAPETEKGD